MFTELLNCSRDKLYLNQERKLSQSQVRFLANALRRRLKGCPIQYILGKIEFMGLEFRLTPDVFIPRPETEILVETALRFSSQSTVDSCQKILDMGTGSGCIAVSLAKFLPSAEITAADISSSALEIAKENSLLNGTKDKIQFIQADIFNIKHSTLNIKPFDIITSNPPYIRTAEIPSLEPELDYEPQIALDGGSDGLDFYRRIIQEAPAYLRKGGFLILEVGFNQCSVIKELLTPLEKNIDRVKGNSLTGFNSVEEFQIIEVVKDYNNIDRVIVARYG